MRKDFFLCHFPVPDFLKMPSVGIDISDNSVRYVELVEDGCRRKLGIFGKIKLPKGTILNGEIKDKITLIKILKDIKKKHNFKFVRISIIEKNSYIFKTQIFIKDKIGREEIRGALSFKLEENVPVALETAVFDFDVLNKKGGTLDVVVSVLPKNIINQFLDIFDGAGLIPLSFEVEAQAVARSSIAKGDENTFMIVDFHSTRASISIVSHGLVQFTSTLYVGGDDLVEAIEKYQNLSKKEAIKVKKDKGFKRTGDNDGIFYAMINTIAVLKDEINKYLMYWHSHDDNEIRNKIKKIILCGESGSLRGLDDYLSLSLGLPVEKASVWKNVFSLDDFIPEIDFFTSLEYAAAIGLAIRTGEGVFLPNPLNS